MLNRKREQIAAILVVHCICKFIFKKIKACSLKLLILATISSYEKIMAANLAFLCVLLPTPWLTTLQGKMPLAIPTLSPLTSRDLSYS